MFKSIITVVSAIAVILTYFCQAFSFPEPVNGVEKPFQHSYTDDVTYEFVYMTDKNGRKFAGDFCLKNNTDKYLRVHWKLKDGINTNLTSGTGKTDIPPFTKVCIATVFPLDAAKSWEPGTLEFTWEQVVK